jgi:hypothetical protein
MKKSSMYPELVVVFDVFGELPCNSSLVPKELKNKLPKEMLTVYEEFMTCKVRQLHNLFAIINELEKIGKSKYIYFSSPIHPNIIASIYRANASRHAKLRSRIAVCPPMILISQPYWMFCQPGNTQQGNDCHHCLHQSFGVQFL